MAKLVGIEAYTKLFTEKMDAIGNAPVSVILVEGSPGTGKTALIEDMIEKAMESFPHIPRAMVSTDIGIGDTSLGQSQPLRVFTQAFEKLLNFRPGRAKKRFAYNLGITVLTAIPLVGDVFYAAKEIGRDWEKYQKERDEENPFSSSQIEDFYGALVQMSKKNPLLIAIDDAHAADAASIELLAEVLAESNEDLGSVLFIVGYDANSADSGPSPFASWLAGIKKSLQSNLIELRPFSIKQLRDWLKINLDSYEINEDFENWIYQRTGGNQSTLAEYLRYFKKNPPIDGSGSFRKDFYEQFLPPTVYDAVNELGSQLSQEEMDFLCTAAAEGSEFTVYMMSLLTGKDAIAVIRQLRSLENDYGLIRSLGPRSRYGEKTTVYTFTRHFYHHYFESQLQWEEQAELHGRIAETLNKKFLQASSIEEKAELVGYIAAHSREAGDEQLAENILKESSNIIGTSASEDLAKSLGLSVEAILETDYKENQLAENNNDIQGSEVAEDLPGLPLDIGLPFEMLRHRVATYHNLEKYSEAYEETRRHIIHGDKVYTEPEMVMLFTMQAKTLIELDEIDKASSVLDQAKEIAGENPDESLICLIMNVESILLEELGQHDQAEQLLREAAKLVVRLQPELKIMTLTNIGRITEVDNPKLAQRYYEASEKIRSELSLSGLII